MNFPAAPELRDTAVAPSPGQEEIFNVRTGLATVLDSWKLAVSIFAAAIVFGLYKIWVAQPMYEANVLIEVETRSSGFAVGPESMGMESYYGMPAAVSAQMEIIKSRRVLGEAAEQMGLVIQATPAHMGQIGSAIARRYQGSGLRSAPWFIPGADKYAWGGESISITDLTMPEASYGQGFLLVAGADGAYTLFDSNENQLATGKVGSVMTVPLGEGRDLKMLVAQLKARPETRFYVTRMKTKDAADWLRGGLKVVEKGARNAYTGSGILELTLKASSPQLAADVANAVAMAYLRQNVDRLSQGAERKIDFLNSQLPRLQAEVSSAEQALLEQRTKSGPYQLSEGAKSILESLTTIERELSELELERAELSQTLTPQHPAMATVNRKREQLEQERSRINSKIATLPDAESRLLQLTRDSKVASELYVALLNKSQELKVAKAGTIGNVHIVDMAVPVNFRVEPQARRLLLSWAALGVVVALAAVFLRKHLNVKLDWPEDAERRIGIPVYATIPLSDKQIQLDKQAEKGELGRRLLLAESDPKDIAVESLRSLRASLHFAMMDAKRNLAVITGSTPNVGKSFIAANLARLMADSGRRVLLIDADMRKGRVNKMFGLERSPGLSEVISGQMPLSEVIHKVDDRFSVVTTGKLPPNPAELLGSEWFVAVVEAACKDYDLVLLDTPPILNLADTVLVAKSAGALFVVIRGGVSTVPDVQDCVQRFGKNGIKVDGLIFNGLKPGVGSYVHPQYYHYRYRYGRYRYGGQSQ